MRVLMLGWDFSPRLSGGVGSACQGLATALARASDADRAEVVFLLPRVRGDEEPNGVRLLDGERARELPNAAPPPAPASASELAPLDDGPVAERESAPQPKPPLPAPADALRLLAIDSPLRPYLSPEDYAGAVDALLARIRAAAQPARSRPPRAAARARALGAARAGAARASSAPAAPESVSVSVPPYGRTLGAEVERYARAALALAQRESFDVIHAHDWMTFPAGMLLQERTGKPLVVHFHSTEFERRGPLASGEARAVEQAGLDAATRVLCVSQAGLRALRAHYAVELAKVRVLHNAYSPLPDTPAPPREAPVVLYLGRLSEQKSPDVFLRAAARVHARNPRATFVLAGEGELYPELRELARELGLSRAARFTGFVAGEELARTYAGADVYVLSSGAEPFGISALEALSLGVPTIVPSGAGVTEVVRSVLRFEPGDDAELAEKIVALLERPALRRQLSAAGLREVQRVRWERPARALRAVYDELVAAP